MTTTPKMSSRRPTSVPLRGLASYGTRRACRHGDNAVRVPERRNLMRPDPATIRKLQELDDAALVALAQSGETSAFWVITKRNIRRLYRVARAVLRDDNDAEDVVQESYFRALATLSEFRAEASLSTWLTRMVFNEGL